MQLTCIHVNPRRLQVAMDVNDEDSAIPVRVDLLENLQPEEILTILNEVRFGKYKNSGNVPPVLPKEGHLYIYDLGCNNELWENKKKKYR